MPTPLARLVRWSAGRTVLLALVLAAGAVVAQLRMPFLAVDSALRMTRVDTPDICDSLPHTMVGGIDLSGRWSSNYGPVVFTHVGASVSGTIAYTSGGAGTITGCFDGQTLYYGYDNADDSGSGALTYSGDGCRLDGYFVSDVDGSRGNWTLSRC